MIRPSWNEYFMGIALAVAERSTCNRANVGAVIATKDHNIVSTGYNGSVSLGGHCDDVGHLMVGGHCVRTVHAEQNAIVMAAKNGIKINGCVMYVTHYPCLSCYKLISNSGIAIIVYREDYSKDPNIDVIRKDQVKKVWLTKI